ncbi:MAG: (2Fe-2S)-binding protein [Bacteroidota bacterium]|jgi:nicotinate dehydrogenase subunit A|nr:(2Fe-2S)-binding protein [Bacteroidota bacterium]
MKTEITLQVNGKARTFKSDPGTPLLYILRNYLYLNGPKYGCGLEQCGSCMVLLNGQAEPSCLIPVSAVKDKSVTTLEGLVSKDGTLHPVQKAFIEEQAAQCGFCLNGMVISAVALLQKHNNPDEKRIRESMQRVLCRCGVQPRVIKAIQKAAKEYSP